MNLPFAYLVNAALLTRLPLLLADHPVRGARVLAATAVQFMALSAFAPGRAVALAATVIAATNGLAWGWENRHGAGRGLPAVRLVVLAMIATGFAVLCSPMFGLRFRPDLGVLADRIGVFFVPIAWLHAVRWTVFNSCLLGVLLCLNEANLFVRLVIETYD